MKDQPCLHGAERRERPSPSPRERGWVTRDIKGFATEFQWYKFFSKRLSVIGTVRFNEVFIDPGDCNGSVTMEKLA